MEGSYQFVEKLSDLDEEGKSASDRPVFALMEFEHPVTIVPDCKGGRKRLSKVQRILSNVFSFFAVLGSRLDVDVKTSNCRLAFHGQLSHPFKEAASELAKGGGLGVFKYKVKEGVVERASNECEVICKGMFKKETNLALFGGLAVRLSTGEEGAIGEPFGQSGKFKVRVPGESESLPGGGCNI